MDTFLAAFNRKGSAASTRVKSQKHIPWVEKYRPKSVDDVAYQHEAVSALKKCLEGADLPNLLFYGPPGTGKTSLILAVARQLFGPLYSERVLELNASDERGIDVIRQKVKTFAQVAVSTARGNEPGEKDKPPPYKLIVLDEADSMTAPAQAALRRTMETETRTTRFCLTCNYVTRIIDPITSRCAKFRFRPLDNEVARDRLRFICQSEQLIATDDTLDHVLRLSHGDLRRAITLLQSVYQLMNPETDDSVQAGDSELFGITCAQLDEVASVVPTLMLDGLWKVAESGRFDDLQAAVKDILLEGYSAYQVICQLQERVLDDGTNLTDAQQASLLDAFAVADWRLVDGAHEYLQLLHVAGCLLKTLSGR